MRNLGDMILLPSLAVALSVAAILLSDMLPRRKRAVGAPQLELLHYEDEPVRRITTATGYARRSIVPGHDAASWGPARGAGLVRVVENTDVNRRYAAKHDIDSK